MSMKLIQITNTVSQLRDLRSFEAQEIASNLRHIIKQLRDEELEHMKSAQAMSQDALGMLAWKSFIKLGCKAAIKAVSII